MGIYVYNTLPRSERGLTESLASQINECEILEDERIPERGSTVIVLDLFGGFKKAEIIRKWRSMADGMVTVVHFTQNKDMSDRGEFDDYYLIWMESITAEGVFLQAQPWINEALPGVIKT